MGDPRKIRGKYQGPRHPWNKERIEEEKKLLREYGLTNKKELWKAQSKLTNFKDMTKKLIAQTSEQSEKELGELFTRLKKIGLLSVDGAADDVLGLGTSQILDRRLQTVVFKKGLARSVKQARQFITHGHIVIGGKKVTVPGYIVPVSEEHDIGFLQGSSLFSEDHPERAVPEKASKGSKSEGSKAKEVKSEEAKAEEEAPVTKTKEIPEEEKPVEEQIKDEVTDAAEVKEAVEEAEADKIVEDHKEEVEEKASEEAKK